MDEPLHDRFQQQMLIGSEILQTESRKNQKQALAAIKVRWLMVFKFQNKRIVAIDMHDRTPNSPSA